MKNYDELHELIDYWNYIIQSVIINNYILYFTLLYTY